MATYRKVTYCPTFFLGWDEKEKDDLRRKEIMEWMDENDIELIIPDVTVRSKDIIIIEEMKRYANFQYNHFYMSEEDALLFELRWK